VTENDPILAELAAKLAEAETWEDESREKLGRLFGEMRIAFAKMAANPRITPEDRTQRRGEMRARWIDVFEHCRKIEATEEELLQQRANLAEKMRDLSMITARMIHQIKTAIDTGEFTGTWEQREEWLEHVRDFEEHKESFLEDLTAEDIRKLRDEGVL
jgi:hypothetical protein